MRSINVTTDVYAAIWAARQRGEETEDAILARIFKVPNATTGEKSGRQIGFSDARFDINLPEGFEIFRNHKGKEYRAKAFSGQWVLVSTGRPYPSLNQLSKATSGNTENAWRNWYFMGSDGKRHLIEKLRNDIDPNARHLVKGL
jgi:hypothetical protein